ncbi:MAG: ROK family protein [Methanoregula sp.]
MIKKNLKSTDADKVFFIGVDIGKTKIAAGIIDNHGNVIFKKELPTNMKEGGLVIVDQCKTLIRQLISESSFFIKAIGIGSSGVIDYNEGLIISSGSIPNWNKIPIQHLIQKEFNIYTRVDNDVYVAALGEHIFGAGINRKVSVYMTISTGVGIAIIQNNKIWHGVHNLSGQIAHLPLFSNETVNDVISGKGISKKGSIKLGKELSTNEIFRRRSDDQENTKEIIDNAIQGSSLIISWLSNTVDPELFILGGSVILKEDTFFNEILSESKKYLAKYNSQLPEGPIIVKAKLGSNSGIVGAAALVMND